MRPARTSIRILLGKLAFPMPVLFVAAQVGVVGGCDSPAPTGDPVETATSALWLRTGVNLWPHDGNGLTSIRTCFLPGSFTTAQQTAMRRIVEDGWERAAFLDFWDWGTCSGLPSNTVILQVDPQLTVLSASSAVGKNPNGGNLIRFKRGDLAANAYTVLHEFGHALGFIDETDSFCSQRTGGGTSLEWQNDWALSVMHTGCSFEVSSLSAWDILGVRNAYGFKPSGTIAGLGGLALDVAGASSDAGTPIIGWPATGSVNDKWLRILGALFSDISTSDPNDRCIAIQGGKLAPSGGTPLVSAGCNVAPPGGFHFVNVFWRAMGKMCISADSSAAGSGLSLAICDASSARQRWDFFETDGESVRLNGTNLCVTVPSMNITFGTRPVLAPCGLLNPQQTTSWSGGIVSFRDSSVPGLCLNVSGGTTAVGNPLILWDCDPGAFNERFTIFGQITTLGQCVNMFGGVPFDGVTIGMYPCSGGQPNEMWEWFL